MRENTRKLKQKDYFMKHLILACLLFGSAYSYEARLFGQFGIANSLCSNISYYKKYFSSDLGLKIGYEQNIINHHILQAHYATFFTSHFLGLNYIYELPLRYGFLGFYGGFDLGAGTIYRTIGPFLWNLNIGTRYRMKDAFIELGLYPVGFMFSIGVAFNL